MRICVKKNEDNQLKVLDVISLEYDFGFDGIVFSTFDKRSFLIPNIDESVANCIIRTLCVEGCFDFHVAYDPIVELRFIV